MSAMTIGELANVAGVHLETVRYYQRRGLLPEPQRPLHGYRRYGDDVADRIRFIKRAQGLGFTLSEVGCLLNLQRDRCGETRDMATQKLAETATELRSLQRRHRLLRYFVDACETSPAGNRCVLLSAIETGRCCEPSAGEPTNG